MFATGAAARSRWRGRRRALTDRAGAARDASVHDRRLCVEQDGRTAVKRYKALRLWRWVRSPCRSPCSRSASSQASQPTHHGSSRPSGTGSVARNCSRLRRFAALAPLARRREELAARCLRHDISHSYQSIFAALSKAIVNRSTNDFISSTDCIAVAYVPSEAIGRIVGIVVSSIK